MSDSRREAILPLLQQPDRVQSHRLRYRGHPTHLGTWRTLWLLLLLLLLVVMMWRPLLLLLLLVVRRRHPWHPGSGLRRRDTPRSVRPGLATRRGWSRQSRPRAPRGGSPRVLGLLSLHGHGDLRGQRVVPRQDAVGHDLGPQLQHLLVLERRLSALLRVSTHHALLQVLRLCVPRIPLHPPLLHLVDGILQFLQVALRLVHDRWRPARSNARGCHRAASAWKTLRTRRTTSDLLLLLLESG